MQDYWLAMSEHFDSKVTKLSRTERSDVLRQLKVDLGLKEEYVEVLV